MTPYCKPQNAGLASTPDAVARKLAALFDALDAINATIVDGKILHDLAQVRANLRERLEAPGLAAPGWTVSYQTGQLRATNRCHVYPPNSPAGKRIRRDRAER